MGKQTAALLLAAFLLTSCSSAENTAPDGTTAATPSAKASPSAAATGTSTASPSIQPSAAATGSEDASASPGASASPAAGSVNGNTNSEEQTGLGTEVKVPLLYHMNKNYDIKPNEEGTNKKVVLLTFDDGPKEAKLINSIIDTLDKHKAKAIFFVNGYRIKEHPELLKLIHERGGIIGNHSWDHIVLKDKPYTAVKKQIEDVQKIVKEVTGEAPVFFRPPHGAGGDVGKKVAAENGMLYMTWSNGSLDWTMKEKDTGKTEKLIKNVTEQLHSGSNILMHELPWTTEALDKLLTTLESKGYGFVDPRSIELKMR
ncbi:Peptidoglycan/xylan/chitin deacetylase, PgdA/CDA1 family [Paenibacillus sophorae]|uniref:Peptidoglycan/xylan/chitin deacetylase, PgdA/CDA1 family n=1 Tax=Paenibacillus sophorae TaxID=1333845 RepID=A0A1H8NE47_9BACL|nr:polysaccharide deacetylase family protein [Paenibacillus sophorae]QWU14661.1 polysaccharide deacetylase family protein [Paenibacillus sophorae]SEO27867.1 Peptidoglycan/xylan/chitin deacetylase, PgdA/CDA1 family [Paenibacillus sophorae]